MSDWEIQPLKLEPLDDVARFNAQQDFTRPGVVMGADGIVRPYFPPPDTRQTATKFPAIWQSLLRRLRSG